MFGLRLGDAPRICVTGTPKPTPFVRRLQNDKRTVDVVGSTYENRENLTEYFFDSIHKYEGTRVGRQEIYGEVLNPEAFPTPKTLRANFRKTPLVVRPTLIARPMHDCSIHSESKRST